MGSSQKVEPELHMATKKLQFFVNFSKSKAQKALQKLRARRGRAQAGLGLITRMHIGVKSKKSAISGRHNLFAPINVFFKSGPERGLQKLINFKNVHS